MSFLSFTSDHTWWRLFQKRIVRAKLDIYGFFLLWLISHIYCGLDRQTRATWSTIQMLHMLYLFCYIIWQKENSQLSSCITMCFYLHVISLHVKLTLFYITLILISQRDNDPSVSCKSSSLLSIIIMICLNETPMRG